MSVLQPNQAASIVEEEITVIEPKHHGPTNTFATEPCPHTESLSIDPSPGIVSTKATTLVDDQSDIGYIQIMSPVKAMAITLLAPANGRDVIAHESPSISNDCAAILNVDSTDTPGEDEKVDNTDDTILVINPTPANVLNDAPTLETNSFLIDNKLKCYDAHNLSSETALDGTQCDVTNSKEEHSSGPAESDAHTLSLEKEMDGTLSISNTRNDEHLSDPIDSNNFPPLSTNTAGIDLATIGPVLHTFDIEGQQYEIRSYIEEGETSHQKEETNDFQDVQSRHSKKAVKRPNAPRTVKARSYDPNLEVGTVSEITRYWPSRKSTTMEKIVTTKSYSGPFCLRMDDKERIADFHGRVRELANEAENLRRPFTEDSLVLKVLRALPESYAMDAKAIHHAHDIKNMTLDQLMGNVETIELQMNEELKRKKNDKPITFHSLVDEDDNEDDTAQDEDFQEQLSLFTRQFKKQWQAFMSTWSDDEEQTEDVVGNNNCAFVTQHEGENIEDTVEQLTVLQEKWTVLLLIHKRNILEKNQLAAEVYDLRKKLDEVKQQLNQSEGEKSDMKYELTQLRNYQKWMKSAGAKKIEEMVSTSKFYGD
ncbi:unnamed protein product [Cuscuta campestris]|uniref:Uncharacterized protein n=1 Tax=Cuscuta campestris TaxID=132261 RepID=A0A484K219_9ASTE|nr:unnamed protein product [Cuscuta campestris]